MTPYVKRGRWVTAWLALACLGLLLVSPLSAQEPKLRATLKGHASTIVAVAFSPDSKTVVSASHDGRLKLWDVTAGKERATLGEYRGCLGCVAFSPDGKTLASGVIGSPGYFPELEQVRLWDVATGKVRAVLKGHEGCVYSAAFGPDGKTLASVSEDETVRLWRMATGKEQAAFQGHTEANKKASGPIHNVMSVAFSPDGKTLAAANYDMTVKVWDLATAKRTSLQGHTHAVYYVAFSPDGKTLASGSGSCPLRESGFARLTANVKA